MGLTCQLSNPSYRSWKNDGYTYRRVQVDEDGARNIFAAAGLGEESVVGTSITSIFSSLCVDGSIGLKAMLEEITVCVRYLC